MGTPGEPVPGGIRAGVVANPCRAAWAAVPKTIIRQIITATALKRFIAYLVSMTISLLCCFSLKNRILFPGLLLQC
jgi:hypothetical protein